MVNQQSLNELALFAGAGGGILGGKLLGWQTVCAVEWEPYAAGVLAQRQNDKIFQPFPIWDDVQTFDGKPWRGIVDVVSGGFPCQDISVAGKGAGIEGAKSGMWKHMARIVGEVRPEFVFVENSPAIITRGLGTVLNDLAALGYDCKWTVLGAADIGAPHQRDRFWLVANSRFHRCGKRTSKQISGKYKRTPNACINGEEESMANANSSQRQGVQFSERSQQESANASQSRWWAIEPPLGRMAHGVANRSNQLKAIGNGQVPAVAAVAFKYLTGLL